MQHNADHGGRSSGTVAVLQRTARYRTAREWGRGPSFRRRRRSNESQPRRFEKNGGRRGGDQQKSAAHLLFGGSRKSTQPSRPIRWTAAGRKGYSADGRRVDVHFRHGVASNRTIDGRRCRTVSMSCRLSTWTNNQLADKTSSDWWVDKLIDFEIDTLILFVLIMWTRGCWAAFNVAYQSNAVRYHFWCAIRWPTNNQDVWFDCIVINCRGGASVTHTHTHLEKGSKNDHKFETNSFTQSDACACVWVCFRVCLCAVIDFSFILTAIAYPGHNGVYQSTHTRTPTSRWFFVGFTKCTWICPVFVLNLVVFMVRLGISKIHPSLSPSLVLLPWVTLTFVQTFFLHSRSAVAQRCLHWFRLRPIWIKNIFDRQIKRHLVWVLK